MATDADNPTLLQVLVLERVDRAKNMSRFYVLSIEPTLFEDLALVRRRGRIGSTGRQRIDLRLSRPIAQIALKKWLDHKRRHGYQLRARAQATGFRMPPHSRGRRAA
jgi:predicted DNA-binding WGR domain protein